LPFCREICCKWCNPFGLGICWLRQSLLGRTWCRSTFSRWFGLWVKCWDKRLQLLPEASNVMHPTINLQVWRVYTTHIWWIWGLSIIGFMILIYTLNCTIRSSSDCQLIVFAVFAGQQAIVVDWGATCDNKGRQIFNAARLHCWLSMTFPSPKVVWAARVEVFTRWHGGWQPRRSYGSWWRRRGLRRVGMPIVLSVWS
jgi:hypothetical protein